MTVGTNGPPVLNGSPYIYPSKTLSSLRDDILTLLGFPDPLTSIDSETKTLVQLREIVIRRTGWRYAAGANPPGIDELVDSFINEAQQTVFRLAELDKAGVSFPAVMSLDANPTEIDYVPVLALAIGLSKAHKSQGDSKLYFDELAKYLADRVTRRPPNVVALANKWLEMAQEQLYFKYQLLRTERWWSIPITKGNRVYDVPAISSGALTDITFVNGGPATITRLAGSWLTDGFVVGQKIKGFGAAQAGNNNVQWTIVTLTATVITLAAADVVAAESAGASVTINTMNYINLDFRTVSEAWLLDVNRWLPLASPIPAGMFNITQQTIPSHFELREFFEIFPEPNKGYTAFVKGHFGLKPFTADTDTTTIDPEPIRLQVLAWGKAHFRHPDTLTWVRSLADYVGNLNVGSFAGKRYIPSQDTVPIALPYPSVTFPRI